MVTLVIYRLHWLHFLSIHLHIHDIMTPSSFYPIGVNHLIVFLSRTESLSRNHSWNACRFFFLRSLADRCSCVFTVHIDIILPIRFRLPKINSSRKVADGCALRTLERKRSRKTGIWSLDPWNGNLLCWPLDHTAPLSRKVIIRSKNKFSNLI